MKQLDKDWQNKAPNKRSPTVNLSSFSKASKKSKFNYLASSTDPSPNILVRMGVEKRVKTTRRPKNPPASSMLILIGQMKMINSLNP